MADEKETFSIEEIKTLIKELGGYKKVAEEIGLSESALTGSVSSGKITKQTKKSLELLIKNRKLEEKTKVFKYLKEVLDMQD